MRIGKAIERMRVGNLIADAVREVGRDSVAVEVVERREDREVIVEMIHLATGLSLLLDFSGDSNSGITNVLSWSYVGPIWADSLPRVPHERNRLLNSAAFADVNQFHGQKATDIAEGLESTLDVLRVRWQSICDGSAFLEQPTIPAER